MVERDIRRALTVAQIHNLTADLIREGKGDWPVKLQQVDDGVTFSCDIGVSQGDPADGDLVWVYPLGEPQAPEWLRG